MTSGPGGAIAIVGYALASPFGSDPVAFWDGLNEGPVPITTWRSAGGFPDLECLAALLPEGSIPEMPEISWHPTVTLSIDLGRRALAMAGLLEAPAGVGMALGSLWGESDYLQLPRRSPAPPLLPSLTRGLGLTGPVVNTPVACAAGNTAIAWAVERLRRGEAPMMIAGGLDVVGPAAVGTYRHLDNLTDTTARPFSADRDGFLLGEGGAMFVLEPLASAREAGRTVYGVILGVGSGHDASHPTRPAEDGRGLARAMSQAIADAGLSPGDIGYVNAHSPGTLQNDTSESAALATVFGPEGVPVSSTKGAIGHAQGGANALEAVACVLALQYGMAPPTLNVTAPDPAFRVDLIVGGPRPLERRVALTVASSMGGATSALVIGAGD